MKVTAEQIARLIGGAVEGDPQVSVTRPARIEEAQPGDFAFFDNPKYESHAYTTQASILLVHASFKPAQPLKPTLIRVEDVRSSLALLFQHFQQQESAAASSISEQAVVAPDAQIGPRVSIGPLAVVESGAQIGEGSIIHPQVFIGKNVRIGTNCQIFPGARIHYDCVIGDNCVLHANAVIGADGFGFAPQADKSWKKVPQMGNVVLENDVEVGACTCIDRAALGSTLIHQGAKLDNLIHIAHNVEIGRNTVMAAQVGVAGSAKIGENAIFGGQVGIAGHLSIADGVRIQAQSGIGSHVKQAGQALFGSPAIEYQDYVRAYIVFKQLPDLQKKVRELEKRIKELEGGE